MKCDVCNNDIDIIDFIRISELTINYHDSRIIACAEYEAFCRNCGNETLFYKKHVLDLEDIIKRGINYD